MRQRPDRGQPETQRSHDTGAIAGPEFSESGIPPLLIGGPRVPATCSPN